MLTTQINIGVAFLAGLASFLAPCVLPLVPAYLSYLSGYTIAGAGEQVEGARAGVRTRARVRTRVVLHAIFFVVGFSLIFILLGTAAGALGRLVRGDWLRYVGGIVMVLFGLSLMGLIHIPLFDQQAQFSIKRRVDWGYASSLLAGLAFGAGWTPCVGPALSSILVLSGSQNTVAHGVLLLSAYSVGIGVPFVLAAVLVDRVTSLIRRLAPYQVIIHRAIGVLIVLVGVVLFTDSFAVIGQWLEARGIGWDLGI